MASEKKKLTRAAGVISIATLASRVLGFLRDMVIAWLFGAGLVSDAFFVAFRIPNLLRRLFAEGSLSIAFVPVFTEYLTHQGRSEAFRMARSTLRVMAVLLVLLTLAGILAAPYLVKVIAPGFTGDKFALTVTLTRIMFPYIFFICLVALAMGILNSLGHFAAPALAPVFLNVAIIGAALLLAPRLEQPVAGLAVGVLAGGFLQMMLQIPFLIKKGFYFWRKAPLFHPGLGRIGRLMGPAVFGAAVYQINMLIGTLLASLLPGGSVSYLYYADRLVQFPLGLFGISMSVAILPSLSRQAAAGQFRELSDTFAYAMQLILFITLPAMTGLIVLREPIVALLFERGQFDAESTRMTAYALVFYSIGLWAFSSVRILVSTFYSLQDTVTPVKMASISIAANIILGILLMGPLSHGGLALATSMASVLNFALLAIILRKRLGDLNGKKIIESIAKSVVCAGIMGSVLYGFLTAFPAPPGAPLTRLLPVVTGGVISGAGIYAVAAYALRCPELTELFRMLKKEPPA
ncbi:MAG: murein biosynthesis integral membrane protein MurJ [Thermodesulfobacteriota bacterium]